MSGRALALNTAHPDFRPGLPYGPRSPIRSDHLAQPEVGPENHWVWP